MSSPKFLEQVSRYFVDGHADLSKWIMVFPNKRSGMFMKKYMHETLVKTSAKPAFMPRFVTMGNFITRFAPRPEMPRREQIFLLYDCYRNLLTKRRRDEQLRDFDRFVFWGEMILDDFDDIDRQLVDAGKLFRNLKDLKEISADYLDDEQKRLVRQIWGENAQTSAVTEFWMHVNTTDGDSAEARFINLWELLGELYAEFKSAMHERGYDTSGGQYRDACQRIRDIGRECLVDQHYAFIGFNDFSHSEILLLKCLKDAGAATFFWDMPAPLLVDGIDSRLLKHLATLQRTFPSPEDFIAPVTDSSPQIDIVSIPSNIAQAKEAGSTLEQWADGGMIDGGNAINTAVVLPDESLLTPLLMSIPECIPAVNITMGLSFATTPFAAMLRSIISMQLRSREIHGRIHYYYADIMEVLSHPHIQVVAPKSADKIKKHISGNRLFNIPAEDLCHDWPELAYIFSPIKDQNDPARIHEYMSAMIDGLEAALSENGKPSQGGLPESGMLDFFRNEIGELRRLIVDYGITMSESTYFALFERLLQSRRIDLQGTPLRGLQVMGVLETRSLDFDNVVILSMNERIFPRKSYMRTMIPNNLRIGYGMQTIDHQDSLYTYYFYRLLSRAKRVKLLYDSRTGSFGAGEASRYIAQLKHLAKDGNVRFRSLQFPASVSQPAPVTVRKDPVVTEELKRFMPGGNAFLSASALKSYKRCRLQFYLQYVRNMRGENEVTDYMPAAVYGSIVHKIIETLYSGHEGHEIGRDDISRILDTPGLIDSTIDRIIFDIYYRNVKYDDTNEMPAEGFVISSVIGHYVRMMLKLEQESFCKPAFKYVRGELPVASPPCWRIDDTLSVNFKMSIDRVDEISPGHLRFIDYKTGSDKVGKTDIESLFKRESHDFDAIFQLMTYCTVYSDLIDPTCSIKPVVYPFKIMAASGSIPPIVIDDVELEDFRQAGEEFRDRLFDMIHEIFSPECDFDQAEKAESCKFCPFLNLCGRSELPNY